MKNDPDPDDSAIEPGKVNDAKVDKILNLQNAQFLAQAEAMYLDAKTHSPWPHLRSSLGMTNLFHSHIPALLNTHQCYAIELLN